MNFTLESLRWLWVSEERYFHYCLTHGRVVFDCLKASSWQSPAFDDPPRMRAWNLFWLIWYYSTITNWILTLFLVWGLQCFITIKGYCRNWQCLVRGTALFSIKLIDSLKLRSSLTWNCHPLSVWHAELYARYWCYQRVAHARFWFFLFVL